MWPDKLRNLSDAELVEHFRATGEEEFFEEIWKRHSRLIYYCCWRVLRNQTAAEDACSDTFVKALEALKLENFKNNNLCGWLTTIARNRCFNLRNTAATRLNREGIEIDRLLAGGVDPLAAEEVQSVLKLLSDHQRIALELCYMERMSYEEIAQSQHWTVEDVKNYVQNGRRMFKQHWLKSEPKTRP